jgi:putative ABC transport system substrate-binding protein
MKRTGWVAIGILYTVVAMWGQPPLIVVYKSGDAPFYQQAVDGLIKELERRGHRSGKETEYLVLTLKDGKLAKPSRLPALFVAVGIDAARALRASLQSSSSAPHPPVVFLMVMDPVAEGLVENGGGDGGRFVGVLLSIRPQRQFRALLDLMPTAKRIGVVYNPEDAVSSRLIAQAQKDADQMGLQLVPVAITQPTELANALAQLRGQIDTFWLIPDPLVATPTALEAIQAFCKEQKIPFIGFTESHVKRGALVAIGVDFIDQGVVGAELVEQLLQGADPATLPILTPRRLRTFYNLATARALGITIPETLLNLADGVVER